MCVSQRLSGSSSLPSGQIHFEHLDLLLTVPLPIPSQAPPPSFCQCQLAAPTYSLLGAVPIARATVISSRCCEAFLVKALP